ncbi:SAP18.2 family protein [Megaselia abdita]
MKKKYRDLMWSKSKNKYYFDKNGAGPTLLQTFYSSFEDQETLDMDDLNIREINLYIWPSTNLRQLSRLMMKIFENRQKKQNVFFEFSLGFPIEESVEFTLKKIGIVSTKWKGADDLKTLDSCGFVAGDFLDVTICVI